MTSLPVFRQTFGYSTLVQSMNFYGSLNAQRGGVSKASTGNVVTMTSFCVQGGRGVEKGRRLRTHYMNAIQSMNLNCN